MSAFGTKQTFRKLIVALILYLSNRSTYDEERLVRFAAEPPGILKFSFYAGQPTQRCVRPATISL